ncbi:MAG TPA: L,D-transpeptidase [Candidatus Angelobacter sp.]|nr:L,D-transpeptidase [Candidatus Angelobacter sp.]
MRRLVAISNKISQAGMAVVAVALALTSMHLAASARIASLRRQQDQMEHALNSQNTSSNQISAVPPMSRTAVQSRQAAAQLMPANAIQTQNASAIAPKRQIVISIADRQLAVIEGGQSIRIYPIAVGARGTPSPDGDFVIANHARDPVYRHGDLEVAPGKDNPLGSRWIGLNLRGYGIHGTNVQSSIGKASSHGCFRMRKKDVEELYGLMHVGDAVLVRRARDAMIAQVFAAPAANPAAQNAVAAKLPNNSEVQMASAAEKTTVETSEQ